MVLLAKEGLLIQSFLGGGLPPLEFPPTWDPPGSTAGGLLAAGKHSCFGGLLMRVDTFNEVSICMGVLIVVVMLCCF